ncbi:MAG: phage terminase large subunit family protein [candidate division Zixibacteria bacterium]|nr:phage terminase large subunit family protein [candidate division Zixibacteria bacterium]
MQTLYSENNLYERSLHVQRGKILKNASLALLPPDEIEASDWAEQSIELTPRVSRFPGLIRLQELTPYVIKPLNCVKYTRRTVLIWAAQVAKTIWIQCAMGYFIDQDPGPMMIVYPDQSTGKRRSKEHLQPIIEDSPVLKKHLTSNRDDFGLFSYHLKRCTINIVWAGSPTAVAAEPVRYLLRDEFAKFPGATSKEADAMSLSERRTTSYSWMARILDCTTPTRERETGWMDLLGGTYNRLWVPCPHCKEMQVLVFAQIKFPGRETEEEWALYLTKVKEKTYYECAHCQKRIHDRHKHDMLQALEWRPENEGASYESFHLPSWYAPWVSFSDVAVRFVEARYGEGKKTLQDWVNSDCAEPWEERGENADHNQILAHKLDYSRNTIPVNDEIMCLMTIDVQKDYVWYKIKAHSVKCSYLIDHGTLSVLEDHEEMVKKEFEKPNGQKFNIDLTFFDSGYRTSEVYEYVLTHEQCIAVRGQEHSTLPIRWQEMKKYPGNNKDLPGILHLMHIDTSYFKEKLLLHIAKGFDEDGSFDPELADWFLHSDVNDPYVRHLTAETVVEIEDSRGHVKREWRQIRKRNDFLDLEVYQLAGRYLLEEEIKSRSAVPVSSESEDQAPPAGW